MGGPGSPSSTSILWALPVCGTPLYPRGHWLVGGIFALVARGLFLPAWVFPIDHGDPS